MYSHRIVPFSRSKQKKKQIQLILFILNALTNFCEPSLLRFEIEMPMPHSADKQF